VFRSEIDMILMRYDFVNKLIYLLLYWRVETWCQVTALLIQ